MNESGLLAAMYGAAWIGERLLGLPPPSLGRRPALAALDGAVVGLLLGGVAQGASVMLGLPPVPRIPIGLSTWLVPLAEERLFRSFLGRAIGPVPSSLLFSAAHGLEPARSVALALIGLVLWRVFREHGLAAAWGLHAGMNLSLLDPGTR